MVSADLVILQDKQEAFGYGCTHYYLYLIYPVIKKCNKPCFCLTITLTHCKFAYDVTFKDDRIFMQ